MLVDIKGVNYLNKGAQMMQQAIVEEFRLRGIKADFVKEYSIREGGYLKGMREGINHRIKLPRINPSTSYSVSNKISRFLPQGIGIIDASNADIVLDASGFAYSDQLGEWNCIETAKLFSVWKEEGKKIIMMPQAYGPFSTDKIRNSFEQMLTFADVIFARDEVSYKHVSEFGIADGKLFLAPDFTNLLSGKQIDQSANYNNRVCIIPNYRMIDKTSKSFGEKYREYLIHTINYLNERGEDVFFLIHEGKQDKEFAENINENIDERVQIITEENPLLVKTILKQCKFAISSRFHGIVSALSQGVPCVGTGWSHKYEMLYKDYNSTSLLVDFKNDLDVNMSMLNQLIDVQENYQIRKQILHASDIQKERAQKMWDQVFNCIEK